MDGMVFDLDSTQAWSSSSLYWGYLKFTAWMEWFLIWTLLRLGHHHLAELVEVHGAGNVLLQLPLHGLHIRILNKEGGAQLAEFSYLDLAGPVLVDLLEQVGKLLLRGTEAHRSHDLTEVIGGEEILLLRVEKIKANLETLDLIDSEPGGVVDLLKVNVGVGVGLGHDDLVLLGRAEDNCRRRGR